jgi:ABC-type glycerol-3-phosphate transport system substrate-binding protein
MLKNPVIIFLCMVFVLAACQKKDAPSSGSATESSAKKVTLEKLVLSGVVGNPNAAMEKEKELYEKAFPGSIVEFVITDTNNREQVLKTAITAGDSPAIGYYWGTRANSFYDIGMCLDLRPYFDQAFFDKINSSMLEPMVGKNGEIYGVPITTTYHTTYYNKDMMAKYGFEVPKTWDDMTAIFKRVKQDGIFGFATNSASMQDCLYGITYAELEAKIGPGTSWGIANGDISVAPGSPAGEVIRGCIEQVKAWFDAGYWYPGASAVNTSADDANAAFAQERCIFIFNFSGALNTHESSCNFEIGAFMKPVSKAGMKSYENIEPNVYFIPSNASKEQIDAAVEFLKVCLGQEVQQAHVSAFTVPAITSYNYTLPSETFRDVLGELAAGNLIAGINPTRTSSEMQTFIKTQIFAAPCSGMMTIDETLNEMERLRLAAKAAR